MADSITSTFATLDFNEEWKQMQVARERSDDPTVWDKRAKTFPVKHGSQRGYVSHFLELADVRKGETVLDMGCGTGALATPLAQAGCNVIACDFSQGMMNVMLADQEELGIETVTSHIMSWDDNWEDFGLGDSSVDVALASRSMATYDLKESLMKLDTVARRRACLTMPAGPSPKSDPALIEAAGFKGRIGNDFLYAFNILAQCGIAPEVAYIPNSRLEVFDSFDDALETFSDIVHSSVKGTVPDGELDQIPARLAPWLEERLVHDDMGYHLAKERNVTWAFIAWSTER